MTPILTAKHYKVVAGSSTWHILWAFIPNVEILKVYDQFCIKKKPASNSPVAALSHLCNRFGTRTVLSHGVGGTQFGPPPKPTRPPS